METNSRVCKVGHVHRRNWKFHKCFRRKHSQWTRKVINYELVERSDSSPFKLTRFLSQWVLAHQKSINWDIGRFGILRCACLPSPRIPRDTVLRSARLEQFSLFPFKRPMTSAGIQSMSLAAVISAVSNDTTNSAASWAAEKRQTGFFGIVNTLTRSRCAFWESFLRKSLNVECSRPEICCDVFFAAEKLCNSREIIKFYF